MDKVLVVDDNTDVLQSLAEGLELYESQFGIVAVQDGSDAIEVLNKEAISLVVTDLMMADVGGLQLIAFMTKNFPAIPIIVMTGHGSAAIREKLIQGGVIRYIEKPFNIKELAAAIIEGLDLLDEGASLKGVRTNNFLPLIEMAKSTCLLEVKSANEGRGLFYFEKGVVFDAALKKMKPVEAAIEMLTWDKVELSFLTMPRRKPERRVFSDLMALIAEAGRRGEKEQEQPVDEIGVEKTAQKASEQAELIVQEDGEASALEQEIFLKISPGRERFLEDKLKKFGELEGFVSISLFSSLGDLIAGVQDNGSRYAKAGDLIFEMVQKVQKLLKFLAMNDCKCIDVTACEGERFLIRSCRRGEIDFLLLLACSAEAETELFEALLEQVAPSLLEDLQVG